jgi:protein TonB
MKVHMSVLTLVVGVLFLQSFVLPNLNGAIYDNCQRAHQQGEDTTIYEKPTLAAKFTGGEEEQRKFVYKTIRYPEMAIQMLEQGKVYVEFVVEKDGSLTNFKVFKSVTPALDQEALRVAMLMPKWIPAMNEGLVVRSKVVVPMVFKLG